MTKRRVHTASTIGDDMSIRYPHAFTSMSISPYNRDVVLAGRAGLAIVDLEYPLSPPRTIPIDSVWKVAGVAWCPSTQQHSWVGTTVNQTLLIYDLAHTHSTPFRVLKSHPMAITDIAWAPNFPSWIGTASIDPIIKIWDVRQDQKPMWYYSEWESVDLLAFSNTELTKLASVHRNKIAVWDIRNGSAPVQTVDNAHLDDITSICWHPWESNILLTGSQDRTIKKLRLDGGSVSEVYSHAFPNEVLDAKFTPFGEGVLVKLKAPDNNMLLARDSEQMEVVHKFVGHSDRVLASEWRSRGEIRMDANGSVDGRDFQLVSWGRDQVLRMWSIDDKTVESVGGHPDRDACLALAGEPKAVPSFSANFLGPDQLLHLMDQKILPREVLQAVAKRTDLRGAATFHEFMSKESLLDHHIRGTDKAGRLSVPTAASAAATPGQGVVPDGGMPAANIDEHSSDDDDDFGAGYRGNSAVVSWQEEVYAIINEKYSRSGTIVNSDVLVDARRCILTIGAPWLTNDTLRVRIDFPTYYPQTPLHVEIQKAGLVYGNRDTMQNRVTQMANACAGIRKPALEQCLYMLVSLYIAAVRARNSHNKLSGLKTEDIDRLPVPPSPLPPPDADGFDDDGLRVVIPSDSGAAAGGSMLRHPKSRLPHLNRRQSRDTRGPVAATNAGSLSPVRLSDDDNNSVLSGYGEDYNDAYSNRDDMGGYSDEDDDDDDDDDDDYDLGGFDDDYDSYDGDVGFDGLPSSSRHSSNRDRFDQFVPFPRLCGGVFAGAGRLVCFFSSIYTPDTYPEQSGFGPLSAADRAKHREEMSQELRVQSKPVNLMRLQYYQSQVRFGIQSRGAYLPDDSEQAMHHANGGSSTGGATGGGIGGGLNGGLDDSDLEDRGEDMPQYFFRPQISRPTHSLGGSSVSENAYFRAPATTAGVAAAAVTGGGGGAAARTDSGVGNMVLMCAVPQDHSASQRLARLFVLTGPSIEWVCQHNASVARLNGRTELAHVWALMGSLLAAHNRVSPAGVLPTTHQRLWCGHPALHAWISATMRTYEHRGDVQTLALLACVMGMSIAETKLQKTVAIQIPDDHQVPPERPPWMRDQNPTPYSGFGSVGSVPALVDMSESASGFGTASRSVSFLPSSYDHPGNLLCTHPPTNTANAAAVNTAANMPIDLDGPVSLGSDDQLLHGSSSSVPSAAFTRMKLRGLTIDRVRSVREGRVSAAGLAHFLASNVAAHPFSQQSLAALSYNAGLSTPPMATANYRSPSLDVIGNEGVIDADVIEELDSEEIKQHERLMSMGIDDLSVPEPPDNSELSDMPSESPSQTDSKLHIRRAKTTNPELHHGASKRRTSIHHQASNNNDQDGSETLWRRLRENVLGRVPTTARHGIIDDDGGGGGDGCESDDLDGEPSTPGAHDHSYFDVLTGSRKRLHDAIGPELVRPWDLMHLWMPRDSQLQDVAFLRTKRTHEHPRTKVVIHEPQDDAESSEVTDDVLVLDSYRQHTVYLDHWKIMYAQILYMWQMDIKAVEVLKCIQNPDLLLLYNDIACQPSVPKHDNLVRIGNPVLAEKIRDHRSYSSVLLEGLVDPPSKPTPTPPAITQVSGAPWLSCAWCHEYVHGRALICHACGHGGHQYHMLKWFKTVRQQLRKSGLTPADPSTATYHESAPVVVSDNSAGVSSAPSRLVSRINTADNTRTHTRNPTLSLDNVPAVTVSPAPGSVASSVHVPSSDDNDDGSGDDDQGGYVSDASSETTEQSSLNPSMVSVHDPLISLDSYAAEHTMTPDFLTADTPDDSSPYTWGPAVADLPTCPAGCGCNCLYETRSVM